MTNVQSAHTEIFLSLWVFSPLLDKRGKMEYIKEHLPNLISQLYKSLNRINKDERYI